LPIRLPIKISISALENPSALIWLAEHSDIPPIVTRKVWEFTRSTWHDEPELVLLPEYHINWHRIWTMTLDGYYEREKVVMGDRWTYYSRIRYMSRPNEIDITQEESYIDFMDDAFAVQFKLSNDI
jgi:hypothetical protein